MLPTVGPNPLDDVGVMKSCGRFHAYYGVPRAAMQAGILQDLEVATKGRTAACTLAPRAFAGAYPRASW